MGRILDIIPPLYFQKQNDVVNFINALDVEVAGLEKNIENITDLIDVDKCPDDKLTYLAALTNCPLLGDDPILWRRQIRNWPHLLKLKGTAASIEVFLNSIGATTHEIVGFWRDSEGNLVKEKPDGEPFQDNKGVWRNIRTHFFDLDISWDTERYLKWHAWDSNFINKIVLWLDKVKPFHAELRQWNSIIQSVEELHLHTGLAQGQMGNERIMIERPLHDGRVDITAGVAMGLQGTFFIALQADDTPDKIINIAPAAVIQEHRNIYFGIDEDMVQELLLRFEERILTRLNEMQQTVLQTMNDTRTEVNGKIDEVRALLTWADADEDLE